jgi:hypothetical protein
VGSPVGSYEHNHTLLPRGGEGQRYKASLGLAMPAWRDGCHDIKNPEARFANMVAIFASESANRVAIRATLARISI